MQTYSVYARYVEGGGIVRDPSVAGNCVSWDEAQERWRRLDDERIAGRLPLVAWLVVRSDDDPQWSRYSNGQWSVFTPTTGRVYKGREHAARAFVRHHAAYAAGVGGWIYRLYDDGERAYPLVQGYWRLSGILETERRIVAVPGGGYAIFAAQLSPKEVSR